MKSKIQVAMDWDNQPIIRIEYVPSEDVRDDMVHRFLRTFGGESCWANFYFKDLPDNGSNRRAELRPIKPEELKENAELMNQTISNQTKFENS